MKRDIFEKVLRIMLPDSEILTYELLQRNQLNENNEWIPDSPAVFVSIKYSDDNSNVGNGKLSRQLTEMTGYEVNIDVGLSVRIYKSNIEMNGEET
jgi:hypothetical protein